ncbi:ribonuclease H-like domain-containing protein [Tanacetum coccineum]
MDDEPMWAANRVVALTLDSAITIPETANEFAIKALFDLLLGEIQAFSQHENESLTDAWLRMKEMLRNCHGHNLSKGNIIKIFYHGLNEITQEVLNAAVGGTTSTTLTARLFILNPGEYDLWLMRIEQYFLMTDYSLWEVILNGNKVLKRQVGKTDQEYKPTTTEEKQDRRNKMKDRGTLYGGNKESKKVQRTLLKQQYENFAGSSSKTMDQTFDSQNPQNVAFVSSNSTNSNSSTNEADNTAYGVSAAHTQSNHVNSTSVDNLSDAMICAFLASQPNSPQLEIAMLTIRARRFIKRTGRKLDINGQRIGFDRLKVECYNCHKNGHFTREYRALRNQENKGRENGRRTVTVETPTENALIAQDGIGGYDWSYQAQE